MWSDQKRAQELGKEKKALDATVTRLGAILSGLGDARELFEMARAEGDDATLLSVFSDIEKIQKDVADLEFRRMFSNPLDPNNCFMDIQAGAGGTEAQDWASMLERMYLKYCDKKGFRAEILEQSDGEVAGIKNATLKISGDYAYGSLRTENGVHRLVRKSPFDANGRRHTSFANVFVYPEVDDSIEVEINPADLRVDGAWRCSSRGSTSSSCASATPRRTSSRPPRPTSNGATRSAPTCSTSLASRICAPGWRKARRRRCSTATWTISSAPASSRGFRWTNKTPIN